MGNFLTTRSINSRLWFVNNPALETATLAYAAKFSKRYSVDLYALAIEGNHIQAAADFPNENRADFMRDLNSCVARAVSRETPGFPGGPVWARRYSAEFLPGDEDIEDRFFYTVLQPVQDGLVERISDYPGYNCFHDAVYGIQRKFKVVNWAAYNAARRYKSVAIKDYIETVTLKYARLPGYENLTQMEYAKLMHQKLEERRLAIVKDRREKGLGFMGREKLLQVKPGSLPRSTKTSHRTSHRPRILSKDHQRRAERKAWYFAIYFAYKEASQRFRNGELDVPFPSGTYRPPSRYCPAP